MSEKQKLASVKYLKLLLSSNSNHFLTRLSGIQVLNVFSQYLSLEKDISASLYSTPFFSLGY